MLSCPQPPPGWCAEDVETAGPVQRFIHGDCSWWRDLTPEVADSFWDRKIKGEKQKGKENSPLWPAGRRKNRRSPEECPSLGILSSGMGAFPAGKFPTATICIFLPVFF